MLALLFTPLPLISGLSAGNLPASQIKIVVLPKQDQVKKGNLYYLALGQQGDWFSLPDGFDRAMKSAGKEMYNEIHGKVLFNKECTKPKILAHVDWMVENAKEGDLVMLFIGCHGNCVGGPVNGESIFATNGGGSIKPREIKSRFAKLPCEAIVINDACQSGNWGKDRPDDPMPPNVTCMACCLPTQNSAIQFDIVVFEGLHGKADYNKDGIVDLDELITYSASRIKEVGTGPYAVGGTLIPVLTKSKNLTDSKRALPLTKTNPNLVSVVLNREVFAGIIEKEDGDNFELQMIGFSRTKNGLEPKLMPYKHTRANLIFPKDGAPVMAKDDGKWRVGYQVGKQGDNYKIRFMGAEGDAEVPASDLYQLFGANPSVDPPQGLFAPARKKKG